MASDRIQSARQLEEAIVTADAAMQKNDLPTVRNAWEKIAQVGANLKTERIRKRIEVYRAFVSEKDQPAAIPKPQLPKTGYEGFAAKFSGTKPPQGRNIPVPKTNVAERIAGEKRRFHSALESRHAKKSERLLKIQEAQDQKETDDAISGSNATNEATPSKEAMALSVLETLKPVRTDLILALLPAIVSAAKRQKLKIKEIRFGLLAFCIQKKIEDDERACILDAFDACAGQT